MVTPHESYPELAADLGIKNLFFKREDLHPLGSHKGRSIPLMIEKYLANGIRHFAISSSGNAALAAGLYIQSLNKANTGNQIILEILAGKNIKPNKLKKLEVMKSSGILLSIQDRPLQALFAKTQDSSVQSLRQSTDDSALYGYAPLAEELLQIPDLKAVFMATSSGTTVQALSEYFMKNKKNVEVHIVQTSSCHPMSDEFINYEGNNEISLADAIVDQTALRKNTVVSLLKKNGGMGWICQNDEILSAQELTKKHCGISISPNSALSVAGLMQAVYTGKKWDGTVACMICGD